MTFNWDEVATSDVSLSENGGRKRTSTNQRNIRRNNGDASSRLFIAWDGEGSNLSGPDEAQHYVLFGSSVCTEPLTGYQLTGQDCINRLLDVALANREAIHISFAFNYDVNMIIHGWDIALLRSLHKEDFCEYELFGWDGTYKYRIEWRKGKWFSVSRTKTSDVGNLPDIYVKVYDIFSFFQQSFVKACDKWLTEEELAPTREIVIAGKAVRNEIQDISDILSYWKAEIQQLQILAFRLREAMLAAGFNLPEWHGPGVIASAAMKIHNVRDHKIDSTNEIRDASRYAYMAGHFELYQVGHWDQTVWEMDINSAYPFFIAKLPSLTEGHWEYNGNPNVNNLSEFGVYRIRYADPTVYTHTLRPQPFFHRSERHEICFPGEVNGWYWSLEARFVKGLPGAEIVEGWEYVGWETRPFAWVADMFAQRRQWQEEGNGGEFALKLCMNSLYGKMAQRVGWDKEGFKPPPWHQLEWAGWVTSGCRSMVFDVISRIPERNVIAVETDAVYFVGSNGGTDPIDLGINDSSTLGEWGIKKWDEVIYVQNGLASLRISDKWKTKYRGMDAGSVDEHTMQRFINAIRPGCEWPSIEATTSRFVGIGLALSGKNTMQRHCRWEMNQPKSVNVGIMGKRRHVPQWCPTCVDGLENTPHRMVTITPSDPDSKMHALPWLEPIDPSAEQLNDTEHWE